jgi:hypothetical protein
MQNTTKLLIFAFHSFAKKLASTPPPPPPVGWYPVLHSNPVLFSTRFERVWTIVDGYLL